MLFVRTLVLFHRSARHSQQSCISAIWLYRISGSFRDDLIFAFSRFILNPVSFSIRNFFNRKIWLTQKTIVTDFPHFRIYLTREKKTRIYDIVLISTGILKHNNLLQPFLNYFENKRNSKLVSSFGFKLKIIDNVTSGICW